MLPTRLRLLAGAIIRHPGYWAPNNPLKPKRSRHFVEGGEIIITEGELLVIEIGHNSYD